jgi:hypothetical protein
MIYLDFNTKTRVLKVSNSFTYDNSEVIQDVITIRSEGYFYEVIQTLNDGKNAPIIRTPVDQTFIRYNHSE